ncbi:Secreted protein [Azospirillaceae bacterium]
MIRCVISLHRCWFHLVLLVGGIIGLGGLSAPCRGDERLRLDLTEPSHFRGRVLPPEVFVYQNRPTLYDKSRRAFYFKETFDSYVKFDPQLSHLCSHGVFGQYRDGAYYADTPARRYGVAFGSGGNLYDPQQKSFPNKVYFFYNHDTSQCQVVVATLERVKKFRSLAN